MSINVNLISSSHVVPQVVQVIRGMRELGVTIKGTDIFFQYSKQMCQRSLHLVSPITSSLPISGSISANFRHHESQQRKLRYLPPTPT